MTIEFRPVLDTSVVVTGQFAEELAEWQSLGTDAWALFPYEDQEA